MRRWQRCRGILPSSIADGRPSIPPERLLRALLLQAFYTVRSERQLMEQLDYNLLFRWFVGLASTMRSGMRRCSRRTATGCLTATLRGKFFAELLNLPQVRGLLSSEHFSVDGTLIEAWASMKSFVPKDGGVRRAATAPGAMPSATSMARSAATTRIASTTDPDARLFRKGAGKEAKLCHMGHLMTENRNGLIVDATLTAADGTAERETAPDMIEDNARPGHARWAATRTMTPRTSSPTARTQRDATCLAEHYQSPLGDRRPYDAASRLCISSKSEADRGAVRLDQDRRRSARPMFEASRSSASSSP